MTQPHQLKEYLRCVFDLEAELYKYQQLAKRYEISRKSRAPELPKKQTFIEPQKPSALANTGQTTNRAKSLGIIGFLCLALAGLCVLVGLFYAIAEGVAGILAGLIMTVPFAVLGIFFCKMEEHIANKELSIIDSQKNSDYQTAVKIYRDNIAYEEKRYEKEMSMYLGKRETYQKETLKNLSEINKTISVLQKSLNTLYANNIIFKKYQNIIAISSFLEYFESERCSELRGPNGAYNMFENEIRMNLIISSLTQIVSDLQQIKNNQFTLYNMLNTSTNEITNLLYDLNRGQNLTANYAKAAAIAASADRYIVGMIG